MPIKIDKKRDELLAEYAVGMLKDFYLTSHEKSPQEGYARAAKAWSTYLGETDGELAQRIYDYVSNKWFMYASPVLSNAPNGEDAKSKGLPISCFLTYVPDTLEGLISHSSELRWLSVYGGGVGGHWSDVRTVSDIAPGPIPFLHTVDADMIAYRQGKTRKGSYAAYMDIHHPDIVEFLNIRIPTGDVQRKALNLHNAINITDEFMEAVVNDTDFDLRDPKDGTVKESINARKLWERILEVRFRTGEPYLNFIDTANKHLPENLKELGLKIHGSNLCNEIHLPTSDDRTAVCCLSSLNLEYYDEWKDTTIVRDLVRMLITSCSSLSNVPQTPSPEQNTPQNENVPLDSELWDSIPYCKNIMLRGNLKRHEILIKWCLDSLKNKQKQSPEFWQRKGGNILMALEQGNVMHICWQLHPTPQVELYCPLPQVLNHSRQMHIPIGRGRVHSS